jgi:hypothetical protein
VGRAFKKKENKIEICVKRRGEMCLSLATSTELGALRGLLVMGRAYGAGREFSVSGGHGKWKRKSWIGLVAFMA